MNLPFTPQQFFGVFAAYNEAVWPAQVALNLLAVAALALVALRRAGGVVAGILAFLWAWAGLVYHFMFFLPINPAAWLFAPVFAGAALAFLVAGASGALRFEFARTPFAAFGWALMAYALLVYPVLGAQAGHAYPSSPTFGVPCPTTIFTLGLLASLRGPVPRHVLVIPVLWALASSPAAIALGVVEDIGQAVAGLAGLWMLLEPGFRRRTA